MASKTFSGQLDQAMNEAAADGNKILFIPQQTVGEVLPGAASELVVESDGTYSIKLAYNTYSIYHYSDVTKRKTLLATDIVVSTDTAVTTIPDLLGSVVPVTEDSVLTIQGYLDEANEAKTDAETAQAATEALFDDFDSSVADSMSLVHTDTPSLSIPFNESGRLDYGVGTEYVSGLPVYGVNFTRSTASTVINKSGFLKSLSADEIGIGDSGVWLHGSYSNHISTPSTSLNDATSSNITVTTDVSPNNSDYWVELAENESEYINAYIGSAFSDGDIVTLSIFVRDDSDPIEIGGYYNVSATDSGFSGVTFDPSVGDFTAVYSTVYDYGAVNYGGYYRIWVSLEYLDANSSQDSSLVRIRLNDSADTAVIFGVNVTNSSSMMPYLNSSSSTTTATATTCTVPVNGNLTATGESFTVVADVDYREPDGKNKGLIYSSNFRLFINSTGTLSVITSLGTTGLKSVNYNSVNRLVLVFNKEDAKIYGYVNGILGSNTPTYPAMTFDYSDVFQLGVVPNAQYLNGQLKNFKILPYAASADEVKSWGAPK